MLKRSRAQGRSGEGRDGVQAQERWRECWDALRWQWSYCQGAGEAAALSVSQSLVREAAIGARRRRLLLLGERCDRRVRLAASRSGGASRNG